MPASGTWIGVPIGAAMSRPWCTVPQRPPKPEVTRPTIICTPPPQDDRGRGGLRRGGRLVGRGLGGLPLAAATVEIGGLDQGGGVGDLRLGGDVTERGRGGLRQLRPPGGDRSDLGGRVRRHVRGGGGEAPAETVDQRRGGCRRAPAGPRRRARRPRRPSATKRSGSGRGQLGQRGAGRAARRVRAGPGCATDSRCRQCGGQRGPEVCAPARGGAMPCHYLSFRIPAWSDVPSGVGQTVGGTVCCPVRHRVVIDPGATLRLRGASEGPDTDVEPAGRDGATSGEHGVSSQHAACVAAARSAQRNPASPPLTAAASRDVRSAVRRPARDGRRRLAPERSTRDTPVRPRRPSVVGVEAELGEPVAVARHAGELDVLVAADQVGGLARRRRPVGVRRPRVQRRAARRSTIARYSSRSSPLQPPDRGPAERVERGAAQHLPPGQRRAAPGRIHGPNAILLSAARAP